MLKKLLAFIILVLLIGGSFSAGAYYARKKPTPGIVSSKKEEIDFTKFWDVWNIIHKKYVGTVDDQALLDGSIKGMVSALSDPYSLYFTKSETENFNQDLAGNLQGIGAEVGIKKGQLVIIAPLSHSPAEKAGLRPGDQIVKINGQDVNELSFEEAISKIRGEKGTTVKLTIVRGIGTQKIFTITRGEITIESVSLKFTKGMAVIQITRFGSDTAEKLRTAAQNIISHGAKGIVLDLRNNPGGFLDAAIDVASIFLESKVVVIEQSKNGQETKYHTKGKSILASYPLVVLINGGSASASEIVAGAIKDNNRGKLVGEISFGKGSVQTVETLADGSSVHVTIAKWLTPDGISISEKGITPDVIIKPRENEYLTGDDSQLQKAIDLLN